MIIGLCGYAQTGKDTAYSEAARVLQKDSVIRFAFADLLKEEVGTMLAAVGIKIDLQEDIHKKQWRDLLVYWGRKRRQLDPLYWCHPLKNLMKEVSSDKLVIVTDVRYANEIKYIFNLDGYSEVVRLHRDGYKPNNEEEAKSFKEIDSSYELPIINNDKGISDLREQFIDLILKKSKQWGKQVPAVNKTKE